MDDVSRRDVLGLASVAGAAAVLGLTAGAAVADDKEKEKEKAVEAADRKRVIAAGMTEDEADCWELTGKAAGKFFSLPKLHQMDDHEVAHAIHVVQNKLLSRPTYRRYLELARKAQG